MMRVRVYIFGQVQGVFFRSYTKEKAEELGLTGWVRNTTDGRVEAVFEGPQERLEKMIAWCSRGSPASQVEKVQIFWEEPKGLEGFEIRY